MRKILTEFELVDWVLASMVAGVLALCGVGAGSQMIELMHERAAPEGDCQ